MFKKLLSVVLSLSFITSSITIASFASNNEEPASYQLVALEDISNSKEIPENQQEENLNTNNINIKDLSDTDLENILNLIKNQKQLRAKAAQEKSNDTLANQTFAQKCKKKCLNICISTISGAANNFPPAVIFAGVGILIPFISSFFTGKEFQWSKWIQGGKSTILQFVLSGALREGTCSLFDITGKSFKGQLAKLFIHLVTSTFSGIIIPGPAPDIKQIEESCKLVVDLHPDSYEAICTGNTCPAQ